MTEAVVTALSAAYLEDDRRQRVLHSKIGCLLALGLMPAGIILDLAVYPDHWGPLFASRILCDVAVVAILALLYTPFGTRQIRFLGIAWALLPCVAISWMVWYTEGEHSSYYAGLNLVIIAVSLLMPWTLLEVAATCLLTLLMFGTAVLMHHAVPPAHLDGVLEFGLRPLVNNIYFILLTALICGTASFFTGRLRFQDWRNRHELKGRNQDLNESYSKLAELDRLKSDFFANVSHELRTPLTLIIAPLEEVLKAGGTGRAELDETLRIARDNGLRLLRLINDLLDLVRFDERGADLHRTREDLGTFVPGVINSAAHLAKAKGLQLSVDVKGDTIISLVDTNAFEKVLLNLLTNAVKFTPMGGSVDVVVSTDGQRAIIEIKDSGIGIAQEDLPRIFDRFGQLDASSTRKYSGVGIGLALSRDLVEAHGGTLTASSELKVGTTMRVELPVGDGEVAPAPQADNTDALADVHAAARRTLSVQQGNPHDDLPVLGNGRQTILLVEDEPDMRRFLASFLAREYRVLQAADGLRGYELAVRETPDLALLDLMLPGMNGLDLCARLRETPGLETMKIVLLTARTDEESKLEALERGANDYLTKPFSSLEVRKRVYNLMRGAELEDRLRATNRDLENTLRSLRQTEAQLIQSEKINALGTLSAGLLHEINNPLNFTMTAVQIAQAELKVGEDELRETLGDIDQGMKRIRDIVSDLRSFAYPERAANQTDFDVAKAVQVALRLTAHEMKDCRVNTSVSPGLVAHGAQNQVVQVLINLLTNAAKATLKTAGKRAREIFVSACDSNGRAVIKVRDNGGGISEAARSKVFDPFYTTGEPGQGMGLGLSICHTIVKTHGGSISIQSQEGDWTEVSFDLPLNIQEQP
ncbi:MAG: response regulator [Planctomycetes bacterium]|nr:response regulator [Planctomycetota bacterium]